MACQDMEQYINMFLGEKITGRKLRRFIEHVECCHGCYEELETSYLLTVALDRLEAGEAIDLHRELEDKLSVLKKCEALHECTASFRRTVLVAASLTLVAETVFVFLQYI